MPESDRAKVLDVVRHAKRLLHSNTRTELDAIHTTITAVATTIRLKYQTEGIRAGSYISVSMNDGTLAPETMYVHARNGEYATVQRGVDGSTAYAWEADVSIIEVEPRFSEWQNWKPFGTLSRRYPATFMRYQPRLPRSVRQNSPLLRLPLLPQGSPGSFPLPVQLVAARTGW